jgi:hypothetical protein
LKVGDSEYLGVMFVDGPPDPVGPGENTTASIILVYEPNVDYSALITGAKFDVLEGFRVVATGKVV